MENYIKELFDICKLPIEDIFKDFKVVFYAGKVVHITNYKKIVEYTKEKIVLRVNKNTFEISGNQLSIVEVNSKELIIKGNILSMGLGKTYE